MKLRHAAKILLRRKTDGKYLILWSSLWEENPDRSQQPDLPGGIIEPGESQVEGLIREAREEAGIALNPESVVLAYALTYDKERLASIFEIYFAEVDDFEVQLSWEHERYAWLTAEEVRALQIRMPYPIVFEHMANTQLLV